MAGESEYNHLVSSLKVENWADDEEDVEEISTVPSSQGTPFAVIVHNVQATGSRKDLINLFQNYEVVHVELVTQGDKGATYRVSLASERRVREVLAVPTPFMLDGKQLDVEQARDMRKYNPGDFRGNQRSERGGFKGQQGRPGVPDRWAARENDLQGSRSWEGGHQPPLQHGYEGRAGSRDFGGPSRGMRTGSRGRPDDDYERYGRNPMGAPPDYRYEQQRWDPHGAPDYRQEDFGPQYGPREGHWEGPGYRPEPHRGHGSGSGVQHPRSGVVAQVSTPDERWVAKTGTQGVPLAPSMSEPPPSTAAPTPAPAQPSKPRSNPFGAAKPVDTQSKLLELEARLKAEKEEIRKVDHQHGRDGAEEGRKLLEELHGMLPVAAPRDFQGPKAEYWQPESGYDVPGQSREQSQEERQRQHEGTGAPPAVAIAAAAAAAAASAAPRLEVDGQKEPRPPGGDAHLTGPEHGHHEYAHQEHAGAARHLGHDFMPADSYNPQNWQMPRGSRDYPPQPIPYMGHGPMPRGPMPPPGMLGYPGPPMPPGMPNPAHPMMNYQQHVGGMQPIPDMAAMNQDGKHVMPNMVHGGHMNIPPEGLPHGTMLPPQMDGSMGARRPLPPPIPGMGMGGVGGIPPQMQGPPQYQIPMNGMPPMHPQYMGGVPVMGNQGVHPPQMAIPAARAPSPSAPLLVFGSGVDDVLVNAPMVGPGPQGTMSPMPPQMGPGPPGMLGGPHPGWPQDGGHRHMMMGPHPGAQMMGQGHPPSHSPDEGPANYEDNRYEDYDGRRGRGRGKGGRYPRARTPGYNQGRSQRPQNEDAHMAVHHAIARLPSRTNSLDVPSAAADAIETQAANAVDTALSAEGRPPRAARETGPRHEGSGRGYKGRDHRNQPYTRGGEGAGGGEKIDVPESQGGPGGAAAQGAGPEDGLTEAGPTTSTDRGVADDEATHFASPSHGGRGAGGRRGSGSQGRQDGGRGKGRGAQSGPPYKTDKVTMIPVTASPSSGSRRHSVEETGLQPEGHESGGQKSRSARTTRERISTASSNGQGSGSARKESGLAAAAQGEEAAAKAGPSEAEGASPSTRTSAGGAGKGRGSGKAAPAAATAAKAVPEKETTAQLLYKKMAPATNKAPTKIVNQFAMLEGLSDE